MKKDGKRKLRGKISTKKEAKETIDMFKSINGEWEVDLETDEMTANFKGIRKGEGVPKSGLTSADKEWIADLVVTSIQTAVKPINERLTNIENRLENLENRIEAIENCPTIKNELSKK